MFRFLPLTSANAKGSLWHSQNWQLVRAHNCAHNGAQLCCMVYSYYGSAFHWPKIARLPLFKAFLMGGGGS